MVEKFHLELLLKTLLNSEGKLAALFKPLALQDDAVVARLEVEDSVGGQEVDRLVGQKGARHLADEQ